jgi:hypothetical protein
LEGETENLVLEEILSNARTYLELYELKRARQKLREASGKPHATEELACCATSRSPQEKYVTA